MAAMHVPAEWLPLQEGVLKLEDEVGAALGAHSPGRHIPIFLRRSAVPACLQPRASDIHVNATLPPPNTHTAVSPEVVFCLKRKDISK